ncbi:AAA family ATPase [Schinkia azotoformans]|uniref:AAA family ATPase n=1 Tax=Schinkia azotoformans TaxID=1454 RepID=UPI002DB7FCB3|nr:AAA family ATPase [Schinkia azotoformans]MEC1718908.1 AAA family ATPase [Schinkia azotoformans]MED4412880.1 AAA family ATPase [Schinkia azotoformans]
MQNNNKFSNIPDGVYHLNIGINLTEGTVQDDTFILPIYCEEKYLELKRNSKEVPVLYNKFTSNMTVKSLVLNQLSAIEKGLSFNRLPIPSLVNRLTELIKAHNIQFIIFDNCEELINQSSDHSFKSILDLLEFETKGQNIPVVLCGQPSFNNILGIKNYLNNRYNVYEKGLNISLNGQSLYFHVS